MTIAKQGTLSGAGAAMLIKLKRGFDLSMTGAPEQIIHRAPPVRTVAVVGHDYADLRHSLTVTEGDAVRLGQTLFTDRRFPQVRYTSPGTGVVSAIHRGAKRRLASIVITLEGDDAETQAEAFPAEGVERLSGLSPDAVRDRLLRSGLWTALRARPYDRVAEPDHVPRALFVTAMDTNPLAGDPTVVLAEHAQAFEHGLTVLSRLAKTYVCKSPSMNLTVPALAEVVVAEFQGPHPAGLPGTHIQCLAPGSEPAWHIGYQDVIAIGKLFVTGSLWPERIVALGGPGMTHPRLVRTRLGASLNDVVSGGTRTDCRIISGSVLSGRRITPTAAHLGRYHQQVSVLPEVETDGTRPGFLSLLTNRRHPSGRVDTAVNGWPSGMLPVEAFEKVWPLPTPPVPLLRALLVRDAELARALGCLDLSEEDLSLCSYVCPAKYDYGSALRATLRAIERSD